METTFAGKTVLITGANRGLGRALVDEALRRGAERVYAGARRPFAHPDPRVVPVLLDVTDETQVRRVADQVQALDVLINNAGVSLPDDLGGREALDEHLAVNYYGMWALTQAFLPALTRSRGALVNIVSLAAVAAVPVLPAYSASKAAAMSLTQSLRALLAGQGVSVHAVLPGPIDTDMVRDLPVPKTPAESVAAGIVDGVEGGEEDIFPDPSAQIVAEGWNTSAAKEFERQNAAMVATEPTPA